MRLPRSHISTLAKLPVRACSPRWSALPRHALRLQSTNAAENPSPRLEWAPLRAPRAPARSGRQAVQFSQLTSLLNLAVAIRRDPGKELGHLHEVKSLAELSSDRLPVITAQMALRDAAEVHPQLQEWLCSNVKWAMTLNRLAYKGYSVENVRHWLWVLTPDSADERVTRFLSQEHHKPIFVLMNVLDKSSLFKKPESLRGLLAYCVRWYSREGLPPSSGSFGSVRRALTPALNMTPDSFKALLARLSYHSRRLLPQALVDVAHLAAAYVQNAPKSRNQPGRFYQTQCGVFNAAIAAFSNPTAKDPYSNVHLNWHAITVMLSLSSKLDSPLVMEKASYQAIRRVLLAMRKLDSERDTATILAKTWPPYRIARDGMEENVQPEDYYSRAVRAGIMMQDSGYSKDGIDRVIDALGGIAADGSPTIQTRAVLPARKSQATASSVWAAQVRATRNAEEAWAAFRDPPEPHMKPDMEVYAQMLLKLVVDPASPHHDNLPGDGRETAPYDDTTLSDFEKARISPPSTGSLVEELLRTGMRLEGICLIVLIRNAPTIKQAVKYIQHSTMEADVISALTQSFVTLEKPRASLLGRVPRGVLLAFIDLLCRKQPNRTANTAPKVFPREFYRIRYALTLTKMLSELPVFADGAAAAWEMLLRALSRPNIMLGKEEPQYNTIQVMDLFMEVFQLATDRCGINTTMFELFAEAVQQPIFARLPMMIAKLQTPERHSDVLLSLYALSDQPESSVDGRFHSKNVPNSVLQTMRNSRSGLKYAWKTLSATHVSGHERLQGVLDEPSNPVRGIHVHLYMRALAFLGDFDEMARHLRWITDRWFQQKRARGLDTVQDVKYVGRALRTFRAFGEPMLDAEVVTPLRESVRALETQDGHRVHWPSAEEVEELVASDGWENCQNLRELLRLVKNSHQVE